MMSPPGIGKLVDPRGRAAERQADAGSPCDSIVRTKPKILLNPDPHCLPAVSDPYDSHSSPKDRLQRNPTKAGGSSDPCAESPSVRTLVKVANAFGISVPDLFSADTSKGRCRWRTQSNLKAEVLARHLV